MLKYSVILGLALISQAVVASTKEEFNQKWAHTPLIKSQLGKSTNEMKIFKRYVWNEKNPVAVAESVATIVKGTQEKTNLEDLAKKIDKSFGGKMKIHGNMDKLELHGPFEKLNRMIDVTLQKKGDDFLIITTFTRKGFYPSLKNDVTELHKLASSYFIGTEKDKTVVKIWETFSNLFIDSAFAQATGLPASLFGGSNGSTPPFTIQIDSGLGDLSTTVGTQGDQLNRTVTNSSTQISGSVDGLNGTINSQGTNLGNIINTQGTNFNNTLNTQGNQLNGTINTQGNQLSTTLNNQGNQLNATINSQGDQANQNLHDLNATVQNQGGSLNANLGGLNVQAGTANDNWAQSNKLLAQAMDPKHMAKIAFYTAAGAAMGAFTINLAIQGASKGIGFLLELFTHDKQKKMEWDDFQKAMETWDTQLNDLVQMEKIVDDFLNAFKFFQNKNMGTNYPQLLTTAIRGMSMDKELFMEKFRDQSMDLSCRETYFNAAAELEDKIGEYKKLLEFSGNNSMATSNPESYFCGQLSELRRKILSAEQAMQNLRLKILLAERQYYDKQKKGSDWQNKSALQIENRIGTSRKEQEERREQIERDLRRKQERSRHEWIKSCYKGEINPGTNLKNDESLSRRDRKKSCAEAYVPPAGINVPNTASDEEEIRSDLSIMSNDYIDVNLSEQQQHWFTKIHMDSYCYQYAHRPDSEMPQKCKEFPETLYSLGLTRAYNKADAAYQNSCAQRYSDGVGAIARSGQAKAE